MNDSDASDIVIEVLRNNLCRRLPFVYNHTMWTVVVRCQVSGFRCQVSGGRSTLSVSPASRPPRCCGLNFPSSDTNMVNFNIE